RSFVDAASLRGAPMFTEQLNTAIATASLIKLDHLARTVWHAQRRRTLAASGPMPSHVACRFTVGERAALRIVVDTVRDNGQISSGLAYLDFKLNVSGLFFLGYSELQ